MADEMGGSWMWLIALIVLLNGGGFGMNGQRAASVEDLNQQANATRLENMVQNNGNLTEMKFDNLTKGLCDLGYTQAQLINNVNASLTGQINQLRSDMAQDKIASLQAQVNDLKMQSYLCGMPRYTANYTIPYNPCGCGCNNNNI